MRKKTKVFNYKRRSDYLPSLYEEIIRKVYEKKKAEKIIEVFRFFKDK